MPVSREAIEAAQEGGGTSFSRPRSRCRAHGWMSQAGRCCVSRPEAGTGPILAAAGAIVTVLDNSPKQLERDAGLAERYAPADYDCPGDMANLEMFADASFDIVVHPVSNCFVPDILPVWREAFRVCARRLPSRGLQIPACTSSIWTWRTGGTANENPLPYSDGPRG